MIPDALPSTLARRLFARARCTRLAMTALALAGALCLAACSGSKAGSNTDYADRMATEHAGDEPVAGATRDATDPVAEVAGEEVVYGRQGDRDLTGYLARPAGAAEGLPAVLLIHEWWGLNDNIETTARLLAHHGYAALAVDLYGVQPATDPEGARALMSAANEAPDTVRDNLRQAHDYLAGTLGAPATGVVGWCFGGGWSLTTALAIPELDAAVMFYGRVIADTGELAALDVPLLGLFGAEDRGIPVDGVRAMETALAELGKEAEIVVYEGAGHAFANPSGTRYQPEAAKDAWDRMIAFYAEHLGGTGPAD